MEKIHSGLPFSISQFDDIQKSGAIVDMSQTNFDIAEQTSYDIARTSLIYLRNIGFSNIDRDYSHVDYSRKCDFLKIFLFDTIDSIDSCLASTWCRIIYEFCFIQKEKDEIEIPSILSFDELHQFIDENRQTIQNIVDAIASFNLWQLSRVKTNRLEIDYSQFEHDASFSLNSNFSQIVESDFFILIDIAIDESNCGHPKFFDKIFRMDNNQLFEAILKTFTGFISDQLVSGELNKLALSCFPEMAQLSNV